jgi:hypothetical protein
MKIRKAWIHKEDENLLYNKEPKNNLNYRKVYVLEDIPHGALEGIKRLADYEDKRI